MGLEKVLGELGTPELLKTIVDTLSAKTDLVSELVWVAYHAYGSDRLEFMYHIVDTYGVECLEQVLIDLVEKNNLDTLRVLETKYPKVIKFRWLMLKRFCQQFCEEFVEIDAILAMVNHLIDLVVKSPPEPDEKTEEHAIFDQTTHNKANIHLSKLITSRLVFETDRTYGLKFNHSYWNSDDDIVLLWAIREDWYRCAVRLVEEHDCEIDTLVSELNRRLYSKVPLAHYCVGHPLVRKKLRDWPLTHFHNYMRKRFVSFMACFDYCDKRRSKGTGSPMDTFVRSPLFEPNLLNTIREFTDTREAPLKYITL